MDDGCMKEALPSNSIAQPFHPRIEHGRAMNAVDAWRPTPDCPIPRAFTPERSLYWGRFISSRFALKFTVTYFHQHAVHQVGPSPAVTKTSLDTYDCRGELSGHCDFRCSAIGFASYPALTTLHALQSHLHSYLFRATP